MNFDVEQLDLMPGWLEKLLSLKPDFVYLALHGVPGEDGTVQGVLELLGLPYNGSGVLASALAMDKSLAKVHFAKAGLDVAQEKIFAPGALPTSAQNVGLDFPLVVKPVEGGSSLGVGIAHSANEWAKAAEVAGRYGQRVMVEEFIPGRELTVVVMGNKALGVTEILPADGEGFYDYDAKYADGGSVHNFPADLPENIYEKLKTDAVTAHNSLGCRGLTRVDFRYDETSGRTVVLEVNTLPGFTPTSLAPEMAGKCGISFNDLVKWGMEESLCQNTNVA